MFIKVPIETEGYSIKNGRKKSDFFRQISHHPLSLIQRQGFYKWINVVEDGGVSTVTTEPLYVQMAHI